MKKLNKKGFTLVELLAVIAILGILMLLVMPNVLSMFTSGRKNAFVNQVQSVWRTAETQFMNDSMSGTVGTSGYYYMSNCGSVANCKQLDITDTGLNYCVKVNSNGTIANAAISDSNYNVVTTVFDVKASDTTSANKINDGAKSVTVTSDLCAFSS